jgi:Uma2 family endonuclease
VNTAPPDRLVGGYSSIACAVIILQLRSWWMPHRRGRVLANCGFTLADGTVANPRLAYVTEEQWASLTRAQYEGFPPIAPAFVIELVDPDTPLYETMLSWSGYGVELGWLRDPYKQEVLVYQPGELPVRATGDVIHGTGPVAGFALDLTEVWRCYDLEPPMRNGIPLIPNPPNAKPVTMEDVNRIRDEED